MPMTQKQFIHDFIEQTVPKYNEELFTRSDEQIISSLENIILSCQREGYAIVKVKKFTVIEDYREIRRRLREYQDYLLSKPSSKSKGPQDNRYQYIDLRHSDVKLLIVTYYIAAKDGEDELDVLIAVPRVIDKFYFRLNGTLYSSMYQIVDASTYNTTTSESNTKHFITLKTIFQPIRIFRNFRDIETTSEEKVTCCTYDNNTFKKSVPIILYMFAKYGYYEALRFMGVYGSLFVSTEDPKDDNIYTFKPKKTSEFYINTPKMIFDSNQVVQHIVYVLTTIAKKEINVHDFFTHDFWLMQLGLAFNNLTDPVNKGRNILNSLELVYDIETKQEIHLPIQHKYDTYAILRWMVWEYNNLRIKDNLNILTKKLKCSEYIASIYAARLSRNIYRLSDKGKDADLKEIRKAIITNPMVLITDMGRDKLINFRGIVTDMDSLLANKFTYKGESGIKTIPTAYKLVHPTNLGILDPDASSPSDPGTSGSVVPMVKLYEGNYFSEFHEPITWQKEYRSLLRTYKDARGLIEVIDMKKKLLGDAKISAQEVIEAEKTVQTTYNLLKSGKEVVMRLEGLPLEGSGRIQYV